MRIQDDILCEYRRETQPFTTKWPERKRWRWSKEIPSAFGYREIHSDGTHVRVAQGDVDLRDTLGVSRGLRLSVESNGRDTRSVGEDLNVLHGCGRTLGGDTERLEDSLLPNPASRERGSGKRLSAAVGDLSVSEVALDERRVPRRHSGDELWKERSASALSILMRPRTLVNTNTSGGSSGEDLRDSLGVRRIDDGLLSELRGKRVAAGLRVVGGAGKRVEQDRGLEVLGVRGSVLDLDEVVRRHHLTHSLVAEALAMTVLVLVRLVHRGLKRSEKVASVDDHADTADLAETERRLEELGQPIKRGFR